MGAVVFFDFGDLNARGRHKRVERVGIDMLAIGDGKAGADRCGAIIPRATAAADLIEELADCDVVAIACGGPFVLARSAAEDRPVGAGLIDQRSRGRAR